MPRKQTTNGTSWRWRGAREGQLLLQRAGRPKFGLKTSTGTPIWSAEDFTEALECFDKYITCIVQLSRFVKTKRGGVLKASMQGSQSSSESEEVDNKTLPRWKQKEFWLTILLGIVVAAVLILVTQASEKFECGDGVATAGSEEAQQAAYEAYIECKRRVDERMKRRLLAVKLGFKLLLVVIPLICAAVWAVWRLLDEEAQRGSNRPRGQAVPGTDSAQELPLLLHTQQQQHCMPTLSQGASIDDGSLIAREHIGRQSDHTQCYSSDAQDRLPV